MNHTEKLARYAANLKYEDIPQNPMTEAERVAKFEGLSHKVLTKRQRETIVQKIADLKNVKSIREFTSLLTSK